jgi:hypothetical protein
MTREEFMEAFRDDYELAEELTADDCVEIFLGILKGGSDITYKLLTELEKEYGIIESQRDFVVMPHVGGQEELPHNYKEKKHDQSIY